MLWSWIHFRLLPKLFYEEEGGEEVSKQPIGTAYSTEREIVIVGVPPSDERLPEEEQHNCDAMGCGMEHVLYRFPKPERNP